MLSWLIINDLCDFEKNIYILLQFNFINVYFEKAHYSFKLNSLRHLSNSFIKVKIMLNLKIIFVHLMYRSTRKKLPYYDKKVKNLNIFFSTIEHFLSL